MDFYPANVTLHIVIGGIWLFYFLVEQQLKIKINKSKNSEIKTIFINQYISFINLFVLIGAAGIALTGVLLVVNNSHYGFFEMSGNHWLATKQILFVIILINIFINILPAIKKIKKLLPEQNNNELLEKNLRKIYKANLLVNILVLLNFLFAITHKFYS